MPQVIDPWEVASSSRKVSERKKTVRLAGNGPDKAHTLIKCHNWRGRAVYVYHLIQKESKRIDKPTEEEWETFSQLGVQIPYPSPDKPASDVGFWVRYGKEQAKQLELEIAE